MVDVPRLLVEQSQAVTHAVHAQQIQELRGKKDVCESPSSTPVGFVLARAAIYRRGVRVSVDELDHANSPPEIGFIKSCRRYRDDLSSNSTMLQPTSSDKHTKASSSSGAMSQAATAASGEMSTR